MKHHKAMVILFELLHLVQGSLTHMKRFSRRLSALLLMAVLVFGPLLNSPHANAYYSNRPYMPMGVGDLHRLSTRSLKFSGRVNLNVASLAELKTLPGVNDDVAMKIVRHRPYRQAEDLYKLPTFSKGYVYQLIDRMKDRITF